MTRAFFAQNEKKFTAYIDNHSTVAGLEEEQQKRQAQNMLLSKINAQMLIQCDQAITKSQIETLQKFKYKAQSFKNFGVDFAKLVEVDFSQFDLPQTDDSSDVPQLRFTP